MFATMEGKLTWKYAKDYRQAKKLLRPWMDAEGYFLDGPAGKRIYPENGPAFDDGARTLRVDRVTLENVERVYPEVCETATGRLAIVCADCGDFDGASWIDGSFFQGDLGLWAKRNGIAGWGDGTFYHAPEEGEFDDDGFDEDTFDEFDDDGFDEESLDKATDEYSEWQGTVEDAFIASVLTPSVPDA